MGAGKYDGQMRDMDAKMDQYDNIWDPNAARSETNFNPFEHTRLWKTNATQR